MKNNRSIIWGLVLLAVGLIVGLNALGIIEFSVFFTGWWTLFIIVPCGVGLITGCDRTGNLIGLLIGVFLLLCVRDIIVFDQVKKLILPAIIVLIGIRMIFRGFFGGKTEKVMQEIRGGGAAPHNCFAAFSGSNVDFDGQSFQGAELNAVFGGIKYDLRNALIPGDCVIKATAIFGGIDILLPENVNVKVVSNSIFGGVDNKRKGVHHENAVTVYIEGSGIFGGVDIK